jgi:1-pyrroline-5-carboxylate dehydrogenase
VFAHESARTDELVTALVRGSFEFQWQKCSASSRAYIPISIWPQVRKKLLADVERVKMGDVEDFTNLMNAVIDKASFNRITKYIEFAKKSDEAEIIAGGGYDASKGYFVEPTIVLTTDPKLKLVEEEIFGPVLTIYLYDEDDYEGALQLCDETSPYALTGSIFASNRDAIVKASKILRYSAGNFYINDKPTGAVVGRQPFGGARASGTNDKAGSKLNLMRWVSPRTIKENFVPPKDFMYDYMSES